MASESDREFAHAAKNCGRWFLEFLPAGRRSNEMRSRSLLRRSVGAHGFTVCRATRATAVQALLSIALLIVAASVCGGDGANQQAARLRLVVEPLRLRGGVTLGADATPRSRLGVLGSPPPDDFQDARDLYGAGDAQRPISRAAPANTIACRRARDIASCEPVSSLDHAFSVGNLTLVMCQSTSATICRTSFSRKARTPK